MAKGDVNYTFVGAGSNSASVAAAQPLFGAYGGLSALNSDEVVNIQITGQGANEFYIGLSPFVSNNIGYKISPGLSTIDLPPMRVAQASQLQMSRGPSNLDYGVNFAIWARTP